METGLLRDALTLVVGLCSGVLSGAFGVGGAVISTPGIRLLGVSPLVAVGTTLPAILPSALSGGLRYHTEGLLDWRAVALVAPSGLLASIAGALLSGLVPGDGHLLQLAIAGLLGFSAWRMGTGRQGPSNAGEDGDGGTEQGSTLPPRPVARLAGVGVLAGALSGLLGIGGGTILVPGLAQVGGLSLRTAVATSLVCTGIFAVPGTVTHGLLGNIDWRVALLLGVTVVPGARLGVAASLRLGDRNLARAVAIFLGVIAVIYALGELIALAGS
jgi:uncharacterized membrane protein YfcA